MKKPEVLAPAGNLEKLKVAVLYGADAVYLGGQAFNLREGADNFTIEEMKEGLEFAHKRGVKVYVTVNIIPHNRDFANLPTYLKQLADLGVDAVIVSDPGILTMVKEVIPGMEIHLSTQANAVNWRSVKFWHEQGVDRVILARELSLKEIKEIRKKVPEVGLEAFVHGAMCISYSGRCLLSNYMANRNANLGKCAQSCRWKYALVEEKRPGHYYPVFEDERGTYIFNSKDLCMIEYIPQLVQSGLDSFKIEGRMKSLHYVATVTYVYRQAVDRYVKDPENYEFDPIWLEELKKVSHRHYTTGFYFDPPGPEDHNYETSAYVRNYDFMGFVRDYLPETKEAVVEVRSKFFKGDRVEIFGPQTRVFTTELTYIKDEDDNEIEEAPHPHQIIRIPVKYPVKRFDMVRREKPEREAD
ncbi:peptidase U32 [Anoxybacter fermentans]|uniref:Peptidase U32 n=1 Tax=Anoxybacter fermentans TaxID=1323375 RepID=A0A3S9SZA1_9FIRM|nr:U32 family peptidase [Anoxybacter fermentans]AZR73619.1 peptidase U32 [Anoxybacter fermentans]